MRGQVRVEADAELDERRHAPTQPHLARRRRGRCRPGTSSACSCPSRCARRCRTPRRVATSKLTSCSALQDVVTLTASRMQHALLERRDLLPGQAKRLGDMLDLDRDGRCGRAAHGVRVRRATARPCVAGTPRGPRWAGAVASRSWCQNRLQRRDCRSASTSPATSTRRSASGEAARHVASALEGAGVAVARVRPLQPRRAALAGRRRDPAARRTRSRSSAPTPTR